MITEGHRVQPSIHGLASCFELLAMDTCCLQTCPEAFRWGVVPTITLAAHAGAYSPVLHGALEVMAAILAARVAVKDQPRCRSSAEPSHCQCALDQSGLHMRLHAPAYRLAAVQTNGAGKVQPTLSVAK